MKNIYYSFMLYRVENGIIIINRINKSYYEHIIEKISLWIKFKVINTILFFFFTFNVKLNQRWLIVN